MSRPERNPLDLNNLPEEYSREAKQVFDQESSNTGCKKKKSDGNDDTEKVYECRFCSLKFCKSQALGGHMNRHRQERETETLNRARQLVFSNENLATPVAPHLGFRDPNSIRFHQSVNIGDPSLSYRSVYPTRLVSGSSVNLLSPPPSQASQPYLYPSSSHLVSPYPPFSMNDCFLGHGHILPTSSQQVESSYTCIGAPMGQGFYPGNGIVRDLGPSSSGGGGGGGENRSLRHQEDDLEWERRSYAEHQRLKPSSINRFHQDGFSD